MIVNIVDSDKLSGNDQFFIFYPCKDIKYSLTNDKEAHCFLLVNESVALYQKIQHENIYGLLLEPRCIKPHIYNYIEQNYKSIFSKCKYIITHDDRLLSLDKRFKLLPFTGGSFIIPRDTNIWNKTKNISIIASEKKYAEGHILRHRIIKAYNNYIDPYGPDYKNLYTYPKIEKINFEGYYDYVTGNLSRALKDYRFSIVVENQRQDIFFTEKIINCFATGTIPIYWGSKNIKNYFNIDGILSFTSIEDLDSILRTCNAELYESKIEAVKENFNLHFKYQSYDTYLYNLIKKING